MPVALNFNHKTPQDIIQGSVYCGNDCSGNPFCCEASKKIGTESPYPAALSGNGS